MDTLLQDLRFGVRALLRQKTLTVAAVVTLGVCLAATAAVFCIVNAVVLRPLPFDEPDRLAFLHNSYPRSGVDRSMTAVPDYFDRRKETAIFEEVAIFAVEDRTIGQPGAAERLTTMAMTPSLFRVLRAKPFMGRTFGEQDAEVGQDRKVILSYALWQRLMGGRTDAVGQDLRLNELRYTIVGVMPAEFAFWSGEVTAWIPLAFSAQDGSDRNRHNNSYDMLARLRPGVTFARAQQAIDALNVRNLDLTPGARRMLIDAGFCTRVLPVQEFLVSGMRPTLYLLWGGSLFVLLIGCVNIANLALVRASGRMKEIATRHALGATLGRLARLALAEAATLAIFGGALGLLLGRWTLTLVRTLGLERLPRAFEVRFDAPVFFYALALVVAITFVMGLVPIAAVRQRTLGRAFREEGRTGTASRGARFARRAMVTAQVALALVLLAGAGLMFASFQKVLAMDVGFRGDRVWSGIVNLPGTRYGASENIVAFQSRLLERLRAVPGVASVGLTDTIPFGPHRSDNVVFPEGYQPKPGESIVSAFRISASPGYFESMGMRRLRGRFFEDRDTAASPRVVIVDDGLAKRFWPGADPIGKRIWEPRDPSLRPPTDDAGYYTVVGVVNTVRLETPTGEGERLGAVYSPFAQRPRSALGIVIRSDVAPAALGPLVRTVVRRADAELPLFNVRTMNERRDLATQNRRTPLVLSIAFGLVALFLAALGLYGVLSYQVTQRRREIGIRMALGGRAAAIVAMVLREGLVMIGIGGALGVAGVLALGRVLENQLFGVRAADPAIIAAMLGVVALVAVLACLLPARRAASIDPVRALSDL